MKDREFAFRADDFEFLYSLEAQPSPEDLYMHAHERFELLHFLSGSA